MTGGIVIVDKPADWTSQDVAARLRRVYQERRIGHGGTLDPMATGVLPVFVGRATRAVEFFESAQKEYIASWHLGLITDTQDTTGTVLENRPVTVTRPEVEAVLQSFLGEQEQLPPMYSAVKVGGKKLYELARAGKSVDRKPRRIVLEELELLGGEESEWQFRVVCSKGTYIRTLCADMGQALGCGGCMSGLRRTRAGQFGIAQAVPLQALLEAQQPTDYLLPTDSLFAAHPSVTVDLAAEQRLRNGAYIKTDRTDGSCRVYNKSGEFLALAACKAGILTVIKSFFEV